MKGSSGRVWYWVPYDGDRWLQILSVGVTVLGKRREVLDNPQLTALLGAGPGS